MRTDEALAVEDLHSNLRAEIERLTRERDVERTRCAAVARGLISSDTDWDNGYWNQACERIALAIETSGLEQSPRSTEEEK